MAEAIYITDSPVPARALVAQQRARVIRLLDQIRHAARELICAGQCPAAPASLVARLGLGRSYAIRRRTDRPKLYPLAAEAAATLLRTALEQLPTARAVYRRAVTDLHRAPAADRVAQECERILVRIRARKALGRPSATAALSPALRAAAARRRARLGSYVSGAW